MGYVVGENNFNPSDELLNPKRRHWEVLLYRDACNKSSEKSFKIPPEKVIIFSQFLEHIHVIEQQVYIIYFGIVLIS